MSDLQTINNQLVELIAVKKKALIQFNKKQAILKRTVEYKEMVEAELTLDNLMDQIETLCVEKEKLEYEINKQKLIDLGFECRTGYTIKTGDSFMYSHIIVHKNTPQFDEIIIGKNKKYCNIENLSLFCNERTAWYFAWDKWSRLTIDEQNELMR